MTSNIPLPALRHLAATGSVDSFHRVLEWFEAALDTNRGDLLNELHAEIAQEPGSGVANAFDACLDLLCSEASDSLATSVTRQATRWRCIALNLLVCVPTNLKLDRWTDTAQARGVLAETLGLPLDAVVLDPVVLSTQSAFSFGPLQAHRHCQLVKSRASGVGFAFLEQPCAQPCVIARVPAYHVREVVLMVALKAEGQTSADTLAAVSALKILIKSQKDLTLGCGALQVQVHLLDVAAPWSAFTQFIHTAPAVRFGQVLTGLARDSGLDVEALTLRTVCVEEHAGYSFRTSVMSPSGALVGGILERGLAQPEIYLEKVDLLLEARGLAPLQRDDTVYLAPESSDEAEPHFLVPGQGWVRQEERL